MTSFKNKIFYDTNVSIAELDITKKKSSVKGEK